MTKRCVRLHHRPIYHVMGKMSEKYVYSVEHHKPNKHQLVSLNRHNCMLSKYRARRLRYCGWHFNVKQIKYFAHLSKSIKPKEKQRLCVKQVQ
jgi:hypothetical protein